MRKKWEIAKILVVIIIWKPLGHTIFNYYWYIAINCCVQTIDYKSLTLIMSYLIVGSPWQCQKYTFLGLFLVFVDSTAQIQYVKGILMIVKTL